MLSLDNPQLLGAIVVLVAYLYMTRREKQAKQGFEDLTYNLSLDAYNKNNPAYTSGWGDGVRNRAWDNNTMFLADNLESYDSYPELATAQVVDNNLLKQHREYLDANDGLVWGTSQRTSQVEESARRDIVQPNGIWGFLQGNAYKSVPITGIMSQVPSEYQDQMSEPSYLPNKLRPAF